METGKLSIFLTILFIGVKLSTSNPVPTEAVIPPAATAAVNNLLDTGKSKVEEGVATATGLSDQVQQGLSSVPLAADAISALQNTQSGLQGLLTTTLPAVLNANLDAADKTSEALATGVVGLVPQALQPQVKQLAAMPNSFIKLARTSTGLNPFSLLTGTS